MPVLERATAVIVAGAGGAAATNDTTTSSITPPIQINSGDTVIALGLIPQTTSAFSVSSASNPVWQQRFFASVNPFYLYLWTLENPIPANEAITFARPATGSRLGVVQVYSGVGRIANVAQDVALGTANPSLSPMVIGTPGSMMVGGFAFNRGSANALASASARVTHIGVNYAALLADQTVSTLATTRVSLSSTFTTPTGFQYLSATVLLEPASVGPPTPPGSIPDIVDRIQQWRHQAQLDKIYLMPPTQRAAAMAQLKALADELKQAQIAQLGG